MGIQTNHLRELSKRYKAGLCTPVEIKKINEWYDDFEANGYPLPDDQEIDRASTEAVLKTLQQVSMQNKKSIRRLILPVLRIAAILVLVCSAGLFIYKRSSRTPVVLYHEISALAGEKKQITLSDGSVVFINSASSIRYPEIFNGSTRQIYLKGEAFFEVAHNKQQPFIIHTGQLKVQVLGTSFGVSAYQQDAQVAVAVSTGKVGVTSNDIKKAKVWMLTPGQQLNYSKSTGNFSKKQVPVEGIRNWQKNVLVFDFETLEQISRKLERVYGVTFIFNDKSLLKKRFQLKVENETLPNIMKLLSISGNGFQYKVIRRQIIIG